MEHGAWSMEMGTLNFELIAWSMEHGDGNFEL